MSKPENPPLEQRVADACAEIDHRVAASCGSAAAAAEVRAATHRIRSALTPVSTSLQYLADPPVDPDEAHGAIMGAQLSLKRALDELDALTASTHALQPRFLLAEALGEAASGTSVPAWEIAGCPDYLAEAIAVLRAEAGPGAKLTAGLEGGCARVEVVAAAEFAYDGYAGRLARMLATRLGAEIEMRGERASLRIPGALRPQEASTRTLLVVDDEPDLTAMFRRFLKRHFAEIFEAPDALEAETILRMRPVTHLVVDAALPGGVSGHSLVEQWRRLAPSVRYAAVFSGSTSLRETTLPGVDGVFIKPEGFDGLIAKLRRLD